MKAHDDSLMRRSRRFAADVIREISDRSDLKIATSAGAVPMSHMISSRPLMENLIKMALFSGNMQSFSDFKTEKKPWLAVPVSLLGIFYMYSLKICPVDEQGHGDQKALAEMILKIETVFGPIPTDPILMMEICSPASRPSPTPGAGKSFSAPSSSGGFQMIEPEANNG